MSDGFDRSIVERTAHRPWPMPSAPWLMTQSWNDLLFAHWRVDASQMRQAVPDVFDLDLFDGEAWLSVVPFYMTNLGVRAAPALPWLPTSSAATCLTSSNTRSPNVAPASVSCRLTRVPLAGLDQRLNTS